MEIGMTLLGQALSFALLIWFTVKFIWPPLMAAVEERQRRIAEGLAAADRSQKDLAQAHDKVNEALKDARVKANEIIEQAHQRAVQMIDQAKLDAIPSVLVCADDVSASGPLDDAVGLGQKLAAEMLSEGAAELITAHTEVARRRS